MLHGIEAYNKISGIYPLIKRVETAVSGVEICTSNKAIGNIGFATYGEVLKGFSRDCWSTVNRGSREASYSGDGAVAISRLYWDLKEKAEELGCTFARMVHYRGDAVAFEFSGEKIAETIEMHKLQGSAYAEFWEKANSISYFWVKKSASSTVKKYARVLAKHFGKFLLEVRDDFDIDCEYSMEKL